MDVGRIEFESGRLVVYDQPIIRFWHDEKKAAPVKGASVVQVEITSIDLERREMTWAGAGKERVVSSGPGTITASIRLRGETAQTSGGARLTEEERARLLELTTAIEERLMREFGA